MRSRRRTLIALASATALLFATTSPSHATSPTPTSDTGSVTAAAALATTYSGEDLFTGLLLGHGPVAEAHPELVSVSITTVDPLQQATFITQLIDAVDQLDPTFFDTFAADVTSGDRVQIDRALRAADTILSTALTDGLGLSTDQQADHQIGSILTFALAVAVGVTVTVASVVNLVVAANKFWGSSTPNSGNLSYEKWVDQVAETLGS